MLVECVERGRVFTKHKLPYKKQLKTTNLFQTSFLFAKKMSLWLDKQIFNNVEKSSTKCIIKKMFTLCVDKNVPKLFGDV